MMPWPLPNVWLGVSVEDQVTADERIPLLLETPAALHFASYEPALEAVDFSPWLLPQPGRPGLGWLIAGGESGAGARPCDPAWIAAAVAQCRQAGVPAFTKQFGTAWARVNLGRRTRAGDPAEWPPGDWPREVPEVYG
jgi:protein gp37